MPSRSAPHDKPADDRPAGHARRTRRRVTPRSVDGLVEFTWRVLIALAIVSIAYLAWRGMHVILLVFAGVLFAVLLTSLSNWVSAHTGWKYRWSLAAVVVAIVLVGGGLASLLVNRVAVQAGELTKALPEQVEQVKAYLNEQPWGRFVLDRAPQGDEGITQKEAVSQITGMASGLASSLMTVVVIGFVAIFGAAEPNVYKRGLLYLVPPQARRRIDQALDAVVMNLRWWLVGQGCLMAIVGVSTAAGLALLGIPFALTLGVLTGVLELIPYLGAWLAAVPAALVAVEAGIGSVVMVLGLFLVLHVLEGYVLMPLVQQRALHLPPALMLVSQVLLGELAGVLGVFIAAPLTVAIVVFVKMLYVEDALGDATVNEPERK